ncbi:MAG: hypothetical protein C0404_03635 [Verrucomicrobia bacterium]|nr:hypothetical protein [Verrucomicrobiota bacterium]
MAKRPVDLSIFEPARFDAVSAVVGHVAHDLNNLLTPLLAYPTLIKGEIPADSPALELIDVIEKTARDMIHMNKQLLALSAKSESGKRVFDLNECAKDAAFRLEREGFPPDNVKVEYLLAQDLAKVEGIYEQTIHAIQSICLNAADAMPEGGNLTILTENSAQESRISDSGLLVRTGNYVAVRLTDTGTGIAEDIKLKIFDPFTTNKKGVQKRGSGLGLSIAYRAMLEHGGFIDFETVQGKGTTFSLYFPAYGSDQPAALSLPAKDPNLAQSDRTRVLVVDDEKTILKLFQLILSSAISDAKVDLASNGQEAVDAFSRHHHAVLVMDLHMPVMDGKVAYFEIEKLCKERKWQMPAVIFCTGFAFPDTVKGIVASNSAHCLLSKPVGSDVLVETVKRRLTS